MPVPPYKSAFITGAAGGIGSALAHALAGRGMEVALSDHRLDAMEQVAHKIQAEGGKVRLYPLDLCDTDNVHQTLEKADDDMDGIDLIIASAGTSDERWSGDLRWEHYRSGAAVNMDGAVATLLALLPRLCERKRGHLVGLSSLAQYRGLPGNAMYCATKAFLSTFLGSLRTDLRSVGIAVTDVRPGFVNTPMTDAASGPHPFLVDNDRAAKIIVRGIMKRRAVVAFPWQLAAIVRAGTLLPAPLYDRVVTAARNRQMNGHEPRKETTNP